MIYSAYKLNKQGNNIQPLHTPFPIWNQSVVPFPVLTVASWPICRFLRRQVRWSGTPISTNFPWFVMIHTVKGFSVVNEAEVFWNSLAFFMSQRMLAIWTLVPLPFLNPTCTSGSSWFMYCWSQSWRILSITLLASEISALYSSWNILWYCPSLGLEWKLGILNLLTYWVQHFNSIIV